MTSLLRALLITAALAVLLHACPRDTCPEPCAPLDSGDATDGCVRVNGSCGPALNCCATDPAGDALTCDVDAGGRCLTTCGQLLAACGPGAPCCAGTTGGRALECAQGACAQCLGAGASCGLDDTPCCAGATCGPTGYGYTCQ